MKRDRREPKPEARGRADRPQNEAGARKRAPGEGERYRLRPRTSKRYVRPDTGTAAPVVTRLSGEARNAMVWAISSGFGQAA